MKINFRIFALLLITFSCVSHPTNPIIGEDIEFCCENDAIFVYGQGKISVQPDIATITVGAKVTAKSSQAATQAVAEKISQIILILQNNQINRNDINTQSISIFPQYEYPDGKLQIVGQTAQQSLTAKIRNIDSNEKIIGSLIDQISTIDGVQFSGLNFDKENKLEAEREARKLAFEEAKRRASEIADLSQRLLGKVLSVQDNPSSSTPIFRSLDSFAKNSFSQ